MAAEDISEEFARDCKDCWVENVIVRDYGEISLRHAVAPA